MASPFFKPPAAAFDGVRLTVFGIRSVSVSAIPLALVAARPGQWVAVFFEPSLLVAVSAGSPGLPSFSASRFSSVASACLDCCPVQLRLRRFFVPSLLVAVEVGSPSSLRRRVVLRGVALPDWEGRRESRWILGGNLTNDCGFESRPLDFAKGLRLPVFSRRLGSQHGVESIPVQIPRRPAWDQLIRVALSPVAPFAL